MPEPTTTQTTPQTTEATANTQQTANETFKDFDEFLAKQPDAIRQLYQTKTIGLQNTVKATRDERDALSKQLKDLLPKAEKGSELEKSLNEALSKIEQTERRAQFVEEAVKPEIGCSNPKAAWLIAQSDDLFDRKGNPNWDAIKAAAPELFAKKPTNAHGGEGTNTTPPTGKNMNNFIRAATGRS